MNWSATDSLSGFMLPFHCLPHKNRLKQQQKRDNDNGDGVNESNNKNHRENVIFIDIFDALAHMAALSLFLPLSISIPLSPSREKAKPIRIVRCTEWWIPKQNRIRAHLQMLKEWSMVQSAKQKSKTAHS